MDGAAAYNPRTVEEVFRDFKARRIGIIRALTTDVEEFFQTCDPQKENLCLYGFPNESWEVNLPAEEVPPEMPEPALGINFARDGMREKDWLNMVAVHSDAWLLSVAYYFGARFNFGQNDRKRLFNMINDLPTIFEVVNGIANIKSPPSKSNSISKSKAVSDPSGRNPKPQKRQVKQEDEISSEEDEEGGEGGLDEEQILAEKDDGEDEEKEEEDHGETLCGACRENYASDEFWICCDLCEKWFHGKCVKITPAKAQHIKQYKCPACTNNKRARPS